MFFHVSHMYCAQPEHFSSLFAVVITVYTSDLRLNVEICRMTYISSILQMDEIPQTHKHGPGVT